MLRLPFVAVLASLLLSACSLVGSEGDASGTSTLPPANQLRAMLPARDVLEEHVDMARFSGERLFHAYTEDDQAEGYEATLNRLGRRLSYAGAYSNFDSLMDQEGVIDILIMVEQYESPAGALSSLQVRQDSLAEHWNLVGAEVQLALSNVHPIQDIDEGWATFSWPEKSPAETQWAWSVANFVDEDIVGFVVLQWAGEPENRVLSDRIAREIAGRVEAVRHGQFDDSPDAQFSGPDYLVLAAEAMSDIKTYHVSTYRRFVLGEDSDGVRLEYDVAAPDTAQGHIETPDYPAFEILKRDRTAYFRHEPTDAWECLSGYAEPSIYGMTIPDFQTLLTPSQLAKSTRKPGASGIKVEDAGEGFIRLSANVEALRLAGFVPELLGPSAYLRVVYPGLGEGNASVDLVLRTDDFTLSELVYELHLTTDAGQLVVRTESVFSRFGQPVSPPSVSTLPVCAENVDPPCKGENLEACETPSPELGEPVARGDACDGEGPRVCVVPMGNVSEDLLHAVLSDLEALTGESIAVLPGLEVQQIDGDREQASAQSLERLVWHAFPQFQHDTEVTLIGITPIDVYSENEPQLRYLFGQRFTRDSGKRMGVVSYFRMDPRSYGQPADGRLLTERLEKMVLKYVLNMRFGAALTSDPASVLYDDIGGLDSLDAIVLEVPEGTLE